MSRRRPDRMAIRALDGPGVASTAVSEPRSSDARRAGFPALVAEGPGLHAVGQSPTNHAPRAQSRALPGTIAPADGERLRWKDTVRRRRPARGPRYRQATLSERTKGGRGASEEGPADPAVGPHSGISERAARCQPKGEFARVAPAVRGNRPLPPFSAARHDQALLTTAWRALTSSSLRRGQTKPWAEQGKGVSSRALAPACKCSETDCAGGARPVRTHGPGARRARRMRRLRRRGGQLLLRMPPATVQPRGRPSVRGAGLAWPRKDRGRFRLVRQMPLDPEWHPRMTGPAGASPPHPLSACPFPAKPPPC